MTSKVQPTEEESGPYNAAFGQMPPETLLEFARSLQVLNTALIFENNGLKSENRNLGALVLALEERIAVLKAGLKTLQGDARIKRLIEEVVPKFQENLVNEIVTNVNPALVDFGMKTQVTASAKKARYARTADDETVKTKALELYDTGNWKSIAEAAKTIFPAVSEFISMVNQRSHKKAKALSSVRFQQTLGDWLRQRAKNQEK